MMMLDDIVVVDFSQFLSGPSAGLRLADMGAEVIKIEQPVTGDICRELYVSDVMVEGESTIFHAINRNKQSFEANLKNPDDLETVKKLLARADVMIHNFRPGVMERLGLDYETVKTINPSIVYAEISGWGSEGPWKQLPGQDLLLQAASGLAWLSNNNTGAPTPMGVAVVDIMAGTHLVQGILATLVRRAISGQGALVQVSMFESVLDFQFEVLTCFYNDGRQLPERCRNNSGHAYIAAPYGIYQTADGWLALAMGDILQLAGLLECAPLKQFTNRADWFNRRDEIKAVLAAHIATRSTKSWLQILQPAGIWCAQVFDYDELRQQPGYQVLNMEMEVVTGSGMRLTTTRCPIRFDRKTLTSAVGAPTLGEHNKLVEKVYQLTKAVV